MYILKINKETEKEGKRCFKKIITSIIVIAIGISFCFPSNVNAKVFTYYGDYTTWGFLCHSRRVKYTYDSSKGRKCSTSKSDWKTVDSFTCSKTTKKGQHYSLSHQESTTDSVNVSATIPLKFLKQIVPDKIASIIGDSISAGKTKSKTKSNSCSGDGYLYKKNQVAKLQVRYVTETEVRTVVCQKQYDDITGKWHNSGSPYNKIVTIKNKYPDQRIIETK